MTFDVRYSDNSHRPISHCKSRVRSYSLVAIMRAPTLDNFVSNIILNLETLVYIHSNHTVFLPADIKFGLHVDQSLPCFHNTLESLLFCSVHLHCFYWFW